MKKIKILTVLFIFFSFNCFLIGEENNFDLCDKFKDNFKSEIENNSLKIFEDDRGVVISLVSKIFFDLGASNLKEEMISILKKTSSLLNKIPNFVRVEGHTDNIPIKKENSKGGNFTNWELSAARSLKVLRFLIDQGDVAPYRLSSEAFGQYRPLGNNKTSEGRAFNRRVDIIILRKNEDSLSGRPLN